jgi:hypothetical protein
MKRLIVGLLAAVLTAAGLTGISAGSATAACPYTGCVPTSTRVTVPNAPIQVGGKARICVKVATAGNGRPHGRVSIAVTRNRGGFRYTDTKGYHGRTCFTTPELNKRGKYTVRGSFEAFASSVFGDSDNKVPFRVVKRKHG